MVFWDAAGVFNQRPVCQKILTKKNIPLLVQKLYQFFLENFKYMQDSVLKMYNLFLLSQIVEVGSRLSFRLAVKRL